MAASAGSNSNRVGKTDRTAIGSKPDFTTPGGGTSQGGGGGGGPPSGPAGGSLTGTYPNPLVNAVLVCANTVSAQEDLNNLASLNPASWTDKQLVAALGYYYRDDGGGGLYEWNLGDTTTADGNMVIALTGGRLKRLLTPTKAGYPVTVNILWFGATGTNLTAFDASVALGNALSWFSAQGANKAAIYFPAGEYAWLTKCVITYTGDLTIFGDGEFATRINCTGSSPSSPTITGIISSTTLSSLTMRDMGFSTDITAYIGSPAISISTASVTMRNIDASGNVIPFDPFLDFTGLHFNLDGVHLTNGASLTGAHTSGGIAIFSNCSGRMTGCWFECGDASTGVASQPCVTIQGNGGSGASDFRLVGNAFLGSGPPAAYNTATGLGITAVLWISNNQGTCGESMLGDLYFDTRSAVGEPPGSIAVLFDGISSTSYNVQGWTFTGSYANGYQEVVRIHGHAGGTGATGLAGNYDISNLHCVPNPVTGAETCAAIHIISGCDIQISGISAAGNGNGGSGTVYGVLIEGSSGNVANNIIITGLRGAISGNTNAACVAVSGTYVSNVMATFQNASVTAPYTLLASAAITQGLSFLWPDGAGGWKCSGALTQNS